MPRMMIHQQLHDIATPHDHDVLSGRGNFVNYHAGNEHFRSLVRKHKVAYVACPKQQKGKFSRMIVEEIRARNPPGRFLKQDPSTKLWHDIGEKKALDKTRQALREGAPDIMKEMSGDEEVSANGDGSDDDSPRGSPQPMISTDGHRQSPTSSSLLGGSTHSRTGNKPLFASKGTCFVPNDLDDGFADDEMTPTPVRSTGFGQAQLSTMQPQSRHSSSSGRGNELMGQHSAMGTSQHGGMGRHSQHGAMAPNSQHQGMTPNSQHQGMTPNSQHGGMGLTNSQHGGMGPTSSQHGGMGRSSQHLGLGPNSQHGGMGHNSQHGGMGQHSQHGGMGQQIRHGGMGQHSQHGVMGQHSQHGGMGQHSQHGGVGQHSQHGGVGQHSQHGGVGQHSQHGGMGQHSQHGGMGRHSQHGSIGEQPSLHTNHMQGTQLTNPLGQHSHHGQHSPSEVTSSFVSTQLHPSNPSQLHPGMRLSEFRQQMQQQEPRLGGSGFCADIPSVGGGLFQSNSHEVSLQSKIASLTQLQQDMFAQQQQYQQQKQVDEDDGGEFEFEPRPMAPELSSMQMPSNSIQGPRSPIQMPQSLSGLTNESVGVAPQLRKAPARIPRRGDLEREGSEKSLKMDSIFAKEIAADPKAGPVTNLHGSNGSVMSISIGELDHDIDTKSVDTMPPPKSLNAQELFEGVENQDELVQLFDNSMRIKQQQQQQQQQHKATFSDTAGPNGSEIGRVFDMSEATLGDSCVMYTGDASLGMSLAESFSNVFEEVDKDLYVGSN